MVGSKKHDGVFYEAFEQHAACLVGRLASWPRLSKTSAKRVSSPSRFATSSTGVTRSRVPSRASDVDHTARQRHPPPHHRSTMCSISPEAVSERVVLFRDQLYHARRRAAPAQVLVRSAEATAQAITSFPLKRSPDPRPLSGSIVWRTRRTKPIAALATLYRSGGSSTRCSTCWGKKWRDIYDNLESATDRCEDIANILEGVVLEYS